MKRDRLIQLQNIIARSQSINVKQELALSPELKAAGGKSTLGNVGPWMPAGDREYGMGVNGFAAILLFLGFDETTACDFAPYADGWNRKWPADVKHIYEVLEMKSAHEMCNAISNIISEQ